ncbi:Pre-mRNA-splicing factor Syf2 [Trachymyrmex septentrionalis]|uniref:Pre-mRNA-splicing factor Syf2 n=1 Tax=Trachymyrmex septentrionalis TaxID=34720 RepID=A0A195EYW5_9HYME|nr:Pre-mRNA-splicing factor Syf2 [Trachymyrmex septentrionalis]
MDAATSSASQSATTKYGEMLKRLKDLHAKRNEARMQNHKEVVEEDKRNKLPTNWEARKRQAEWIMQDEAARNEAEAKRERERRKEKLRTFSYDSNVQAVIMSHFLNRAVILDSSDKRIAHLIAPLCDRCVEYHRVASSARGKARRADDDTGHHWTAVKHTQDIIGVKSLSVRLTPVYTRSRPLMARRRNAVSKIDFDSEAEAEALDRVTRLHFILSEQPDTLRPGVPKLDSVNSGVSFIFIQHSVAKQG